MGMGDKTVRELFVGNTPQGTSDFVLLEFLNAAMKQVGLVFCPICADNVFLARVWYVGLRAG